MFEDKLTLYVTLTISTLGTLLNFFLLTGIIQFEKNHHYRTLINQLFTSMFWYGLMWIFLIQIPNTINYLGLSFPEILCALDIILRNTIFMEIIFLLDTVLLCRYIFIFHLKNPTALQEDFWKLFINLFSITLCIISQVSQFMLPGKKPNIYYVCLGEFPNKYVSSPVKLNISQIVLVLFSFVFYIYASIQIKIHSKSNNKPNPLFQTVSVQTRQVFINMQTFENFAANIIYLCILFSDFMVTVAGNKLSLDEIDLYPNYFWFYAIHHLVPFSSMLTIIAMNYCNNLMLRKFLLTEYF